MKIKSIEDFTLEECREYLNMPSNDSERTAVEDRLNTILQENRISEEQKEMQRRLDQVRLSQDVKWIDIKQFLSTHKYRNLLNVRGFISVIIKLFIYFISLPILNYGILDGWLYNDDFGAILTIVISVVIIVLIIRGMIVNNSPSLPKIYNIEQEEKTKSVRRTQNREGKVGLHLCKKRRIIQLLPIKYDNIYYCGGNAYVCVQEKNSGVYNAQSNKMVINMEYDSIEINNDGTLLATKNGIYSKFTTDGYRIIE